MPPCPWWQEAMLSWLKLKGSVTRSHCCSGILLSTWSTVSFIITLRGEVRSEESQVIFDSSYFKNIDAVEAAIEKNNRLQEIDSRVKEEYLETLVKFYKVHLRLAA